MKAIAFAQSLPISHADALIDIELPTPQPGEHDLLVRVHAISVNPVDTKVRNGVYSGGAMKEPKVRSSSHQKKSILITCADPWLGRRWCR